MLKYILCLFISLNASAASLKELKSKEPFKIGDKLIVDKGFYDGCHLELTSIEYITHKNNTYIEYRGISEDCPQLAGMMYTEDRLAGLPIDNR